MEIFRMASSPPFVVQATESFTPAMKLAGSKTACRSCQAAFRTMKGLGVIVFAASGARRLLFGGIFALMPLNSVFHAIERHFKPRHEDALSLFYAATIKRPLGQ